MKTIYYIKDGEIRLVEIPKYMHTFKVISEEEINRQPYAIGEPCLATYEVETLEIFEFKLDSQRNTINIASSSIREAVYIFKTYFENKRQIVTAKYVTGNISNVMLGRYPEDMIHRDLAYEIARQLLKEGRIKYTTEQVRDTTVYTASFTFTK